MSNRDSKEISGQEADVRKALRVEMRVVGAESTTLEGLVI